MLSSQVLQRYFVTVTRKLRVEAKIAGRKVELLAEFDLVVPDLDDTLAAIDLQRRALRGLGKQPVGARAR